MSKKGKPGPKPYEVTPEIIEQAEYYASTGLTKHQIAHNLGISWDTLNRREKDSAEFAEAIKRGKDKGIAQVTNALFQKAINGDNVAMIFFLKNRDSANWADKPIQSESEGSSHVTVNIIRDAD